MALTGAEMTSAAPPTGPRVFLVGYYGVPNVGDMAIRAAIELEAARLGTRVKWVAVRPGAKPSAGTVQLRGRGALRYLAGIVRADRVVIGGGGLLKDEGYGLIAELLLTAFVARLWRKPVVLLSVGVGPFYSRLGRTIVGLIARLAQVRIVRDEESAIALRALGVRSVVVAADPVFALTSPDVAGASERKLVVSVRPWFHRSADERRLWGELVATLAASLRAFADDSWTVEFVALYSPRDTAAATEIAEAAGNREPTIRDVSIGWDSLVAAVHDARLVLAMRYHAVVAAAVCGRPTVAIAYEPKVAALSRELGIPTVLPDEAELEAALNNALSRAIGGSTPDHARIAALRQRARWAIRLALAGEDVSGE